MKKVSTTSGEDHSDRAEYWYQRIHADNCTEGERVRFEQWKAERPEHARAYLRTDYLYHLAADLRRDPTWSAEGRAVRRRTARVARRRRTVRWSLSAAAVLLLVLGVGWRVWVPAQHAQHYVTATGERSTFTLADGSRVILDANSELSVRYSDERRDVTLEYGQAQFTVAHNTARPFIVHVGGGAVRAVGTQFQVRRRDAITLVTLLEGVVRVAGPSTASRKGKRTATLVAGEQLRFSKGSVWTRGPADLNAARSWTHGKLVFDHRRLAAVIEEMNSYSTLKIGLRDKALGNLSVSGAFKSGDQESLIGALETGLSLRVKRISPTRVELYRRQ